MSKNKYFNPDLDLSISTEYDPDEIITINDNLPIIPSYIVCVAPPKSGKTLMTMNFLHKVKPVFKKIVIFTQNLCNTLWKNAEKLGASLYTSFLDENGIDRIDKILEFQFQQKLLGEKSKHILIVLDDCANSKIFDKRKSSLSKLFTEGRHYNITTWINLQKPTQINPIVRDNAMYKIYFKSTPRDTERIIKEDSFWMTEEEFEKVLKDATKKNHDFLFIDLERRLMRRNFNGEILSKEYKEKLH